jgi:hypothetical protein
MQVYFQFHTFLSHSWFISLLCVWRLTVHTFILLYINKFKIRNCTDCSHHTTSWTTMEFSLFLARAKDFFHLYNVQPRSRTPISLLYSTQGLSFTRVQQMGSEADHLPPSTAVVKNEWCYTSTTWLHCMQRFNCIPYAFIVCRGTILHII